MSNDTVVDSDDSVLIKLLIELITVFSAVVSEADEAFSVAIWLDTVASAELTLSDELLSESEF